MRQVSFCSSSASLPPSASGISSSSRDLCLFSSVWDFGSSGIWETWRVHLRSCYCLEMRFTAGRPCRAQETITDQNGLIYRYFLGIQYYLKLVQLDTKLAKNRLFIAQRGTLEDDT